MIHTPLALPLRSPPAVAPFNCAEAARSASVSVLSATLAELTAPPRSTGSGSYRSDRRRRARWTGPAVRPAPARQGVLPAPARQGPLGTRRLQRELAEHGLRNEDVQGFLPNPGSTRRT
jgi:hypothetical protein